MITKTFYTKKRNQLYVIMKLSYTCTYYDASIGGPGLSRASGWPTSANLAAPGNLSRYGCVREHPICTL
jgi:hypothetical protein